MARFEMTEEQREALFALCRKYNIASLSLFGSALTVEFDPEKSDLDFVAEFGPPPPAMGLASQYFDCIVELESLFGRKVDLLERKAIKNPYMLKAVQTTEQRLYAA